VRFIVPALLALLVAASASAKSAPTYSVTFAGTGSEHQLDHDHCYFVQHFGRQRGFDDCCGSGCEQHDSGPVRCRDDSVDHDC